MAAGSRAAEKRTRGALVARCGSARAVLRPSGARAVQAKEFRQALRAHLVNGRAPGAAARPGVLLQELIHETVVVVVHGLAVQPGGGHTEEALENHAVVVDHLVGNTAR